MKRSIRTTFIGLFIGLLAMVLLAVWAMNSFFLENYYLNDKVKILQDTYIQINAYAMEKAAAGEDIMDDLQSLYSKDGEQNEITRLIRNVNEKYNITVVPHILCSGFTREETEYVLLDLQFLNITELLVLRGDKAKHESVFTPEGDGYHHALELQEQINNFNKGIFVDGSEMKVSSTPFSYGVACYPEKHEEAPNIETDLYWLKKKVENGAEYAVTQLFYDNRKYFEFVEQAKAAGINIPIIPGIKPFKKLSQLSMIPKTFKVDLPEDLVKEALKCKNDAEAEQVGIEWCVAQCKELMAHGVPSIHFYSIGAVDSIKEVAKIIY